LEKLLNSIIHITMFTQKLLVPAFAVITAVTGKLSSTFLSTHTQTGFTTSDLLQFGSRHGGAVDGAVHESIGKNGANSIGCLAQSICSQTATATISSQGDASQYSACSTVAGSIVISTAAAGDISLDGPTTIGGDLTIVNATGLTSFSSASIAQIKGAFHVEALTLLSSLKMSLLTAAKTIDFVSLPNLGKLTFPANVTSASSVTISNTFLSTLAGIEVASLATLQIDNNNHLLDFTSQLGNISSAAVFNANGAGLALSFPLLTWAANLTFRDVGSVLLPSLQVINGSLGFYESSVESISAPNLTSVGNFATGSGSLAFVANTALTNISMNALKSIGGADQIANNTILNAIAFPALVDVGGAIDFSGNFTT
jgi:hypothetical protein